MIIHDLQTWKSWKELRHIVHSTATPVSPVAGTKLTYPDVLGLQFLVGLGLVMAPKVATLESIRRVCQAEVVGEPVIIPPQEKAIQTAFRLCGVSDSKRLLPSRQAHLHLERRWIWGHQCLWNMIWRNYLTNMRDIPTKGIVYILKGFLKLSQFINIR